MKKYRILIFVAVLSLSSCSKYQKLLKSNDFGLKYEKAVEFYEKGDYYRALQLFDQVIPLYRGKDKAEELFYYYAQSYYKQGDYVMASYYLKRYAKDYPGTDRAEEAWFLSAYCKYLESPKPSLDQTPTKEAISELQSFANRFPNSDRIEKVNQLIDELNAKLAKKMYNKAMLYFKMEDYRAARVTFKNLVKKFPDSEYREEALFRVVQSNFLYAENSIAGKQPERFQETIEAYDTFMTFFPDSDYKKQVDKYYKEASAFLGAAIE
jgi:outer membrane protein assembly factor BamD